MLELEINKNSDITVTVVSTENNLKESRNQKVENIKSLFANKEYQMAYDNCAMLDFYDPEIEIIKIKCQPRL